MVNYLEGKKFVRLLKKMISDLVNRDNSRYFAFHREVTHTTKECRILKNEVLKLIQRKYLKELMSEQRNQRAFDQNNKNQRMKRDGCARKVINTIHERSKFEESSSA